MSILFGATGRSIYGRLPQPGFRVLDRPLAAAYIRAYTHGCDSEYCRLLGRA